MDFTLLACKCKYYTNAECTRLECRCVMLGCETSILCRHFLKHVLPLDKALCEEIMKGDGIHCAGGIVHTDICKPELTIRTYAKICKNCNVKFESRARTKQYCNKCQKKMYRARYKKYNASRKAI